MAKAIGHDPAQGQALLIGNRVAWLWAGEEGLLLEQSEGSQSSLHKNDYLH